MDPSLLQRLAAACASDLSHEVASDAAAWITWAIPFVVLSLSGAWLLVGRSSSEVARSDRPSLPSPRRRAYLASHGAAAVARVVEVLDVHVPSWGRTVTLDLVVEVRPPREEPFTASLRAELDVGELAGGAVGALLHVRFERDGDDVQVVVEEGTTARRTSIRRLLAALAVVLVLAMTRLASASSGCTGPEVRADDRVEPKWAPVIASVREELRGLEDVDRCSRVSIFGAGDSVIVEVALADGRATTRRVNRPDELSATLGSLLLLPPPSHEAPAMPAAEAPSAPPPQVVIEAAPSRPSYVIHLEGGLGVGGRLSDGPFLSVGGELFAQISIDDFLVGARFRENFRETLLDPDGKHVHARTAALAALAGKRFHLMGLDEDITLGPSLVVEREESEARVERDEEHVSLEDVRLCTVLRAATTGSTFRFFGAFDGELSPGRVLGETRQPDSNLPPLPSWSLGLSVGLVARAF